MILKLNHENAKAKMGVYVLPSNQLNYAATNPNEAWSIYGNTLSNQLVGGNFDDYIDGSNGSDTIDGGAGNDLLNGGNDADTLYGWTGNDNLLGGAGDDWLYGEAGNDSLNGGASGFRDVLQGGAGDDLYTHYYNDGGLSWIADASGTSDKLVINDVSFNDLLFALDSSNTNNLIVYTAADDANGISDGVLIQNFFNGSGHGAGEIEYIQVGSTTYDFWDYLGLA